MLELLGILAAAFELLAIWLVGSKKALGFLAGIIGNILWIIYVFTTNSTYGLLLVCTVAFIFNIRGYRFWRSSSSIGS